MTNTVKHNGKTYTLTSDADLTNRLLESCYTNYHEACEGEEYDFEMSAEAVDEEGKDCTVYWIFSAEKGDEAELDSYDYDDVGGVKY